MLPKSWWGKLIMGLTMAIGLYFIVGGEISEVQEMNNIRDNGFYYSGEQVLTLEQYEAIKQYNGFHGGEIEIISPQPLTVKYYFACLENFDFLTKIEQSGADKAMQSTWPAFLYMFALIPLGIIVIAFYQLYSERHPKKDTGIYGEKTVYPKNRSDLDTTGVE